MSAVHDWLENARCGRRYRRRSLDYRSPGPWRACRPTPATNICCRFMALGVAGEGAQAERFHAGIDHYVIAMDVTALPRAAPELS